MPSSCRGMLSSAHVLAMDAKNLLDVLDSIRLNYPGVDRYTHGRVKLMEVGFTECSTNNDKQYHAVQYDVVQYKAVQDMEYEVGSE